MTKSSTQVQFHQALIGVLSIQPIAIEEVDILTIELTGSVQ